MAGGYDTCVRMDIVALQPGLATTCSSLSAIGAARLDASGNPVLSSGATLQSDVLRAPWLGRVAVDTVFNGSGGQLIVSANQNSIFWPQDSMESSSTTVFETSGTGPLAASEPVLLARIAPFVNVQTSVKLGNRLLVIGSDNAGYMNSTLVWLPN
jgi:hypothetical protein